MKIMFSAGEASGDLHGANLARSLRELDPQIELLGMGGKEMAAAGVDIVYDIKNLGVIGVGEIIRKIPFFFRLRDFLVDTMRKEKPDVLVCIDYPGFNMRLIKVAKAAGIPVVYYILPTIWARKYAASCRVCWKRPSSSAKRQGTSSSSCPRRRLSTKASSMRSSGLQASPSRSVKKKYTI